MLLSDWDDDSLTRWYAEHGQDQAIVGPVPPHAAGFSVLPSPPADRQVVSDLESLRAELARIRANGYALLDEELELGVVGASAPVRDFTGRIVAALNVSAPKTASATASTPSPGSWHPAPKTSHGPWASTRSPPDRVNCHMRNTVEDKNPPAVQSAAAVNRGPSR